MLTVVCAHIWHPEKPYKNSPAKICVICQTKWKESYKNKPPRVVIGYLKESDIKALDPLISRH